MVDVLYTGIRLESVTVLAGTPFDDASSFYWDTDYSDSAFQVGENDRAQVFFRDTSFALDSVTAGHTMFWHTTMALIGFSHPGTMMQFLDSSGNPWIQIVYLDVVGATMNVQVNTGTGGSPVWATLGSGFLTSGLQDWDLQVAINSSGNHNIKFYLAGSLATGVGGAYTNIGMTNLASVVLGPMWGTGIARYSQMLAVRDQSTIGAHVFTSRATATGHYGDWTGTYTDVNEVGDNDTTVNQATSIALNQSYPMGDVTVPAGYGIVSVFYWLRAKNSGLVPDNIKALMREGSTDYLSAANLSGLGLGFGSIGYRWDVDPATGVQWTQSGWNAVELGFQSEI